jgi:hypothetical protein
MIFYHSSFKKSWLPLSLSHAHEIFAVTQLYCNRGSVFYELSFYQIILQSSLCLLRFQNHMKVGNNLFYIVVLIFFVVLINDHDLLLHT